MASKEIIRTKDLLLRPWLPDDMATLLRLAEDPTVRGATGLPEHPTRDDLSSALDDLAGEPEVFAILEASDAAAGPLGSIALRVGGLSGYDLEEDEGVIDFWASSQLRQTGTLTQAVRALTAYAFDDLDLAAVSFAHADTLERMTHAEWEGAQAADSTDAEVVAAREAEASEVGAHLPLVACVRAGGQTGADRGGLDAAREAGIPTRGWCPQGGLAEDLPEPPGLLASYPELVETPSDDYVERTAWNVRDAHATLIVAPAGIEPGSGTDMTVRFAISYGRPVLVVGGVDDLPKVRAWLCGIGRGLTLNVAGPRESKLPGTYQATYELVAALLA